MTKIWDIVVADDLSKVDAAAKFLQGFCPPESDEMWSADYYRWKLGTQNPAGPGFMTLAICDDDIVGVTTITKKRLVINGEMVIGGEIGDTYTHPDFLRSGKPATLYKAAPDPDGYLNKSIFGRLVTETVDRAAAAGISIIYGTPNANSMPGYIKRLNFVEYTRYTNRNFFRPTPEGLAHKFSLFKPLAFVLKPLDRLLSKIIAATSNCGVTLEEISHQNTELDDLWTSSVNQNGFSVLKDHQWFRYRFTENPLAKYSIQTVRHHGAFVGVIVTRVFKTMSGRSFGYIADWLIKDQNPDILRAAISQIVAQNNTQNIDGTIAWLENGSVLARRFKTIGFFGSRNSPIIFWNSSELQSIQAANSQFIFSIAASDNV
jgi:hypothetical protein